MPNIPRAWRGLVLPLVLASCEVLGEDTLKDRLSGNINLAWTNADAELRVAGDVRLGTPSDEFHIRPKFRVPFQNADTHLVLLDRHADSWRAGGDLEYTRTMQESSNTKILGVALSADWGIARYEFYPDGGATKSAVWRSAWSLEFRVRYDFDEAKANGVSVAPQVAASYNRNATAADKVGVVAPATEGAPALATLEIVAPPVLGSRVDVRVAVPFALTGPWGMGPSVAYRLVGNPNSADPTGKVQRLQLELWGYYFPKVAEIPNARVGMAPVLSVRTQGTDEGDSVSLGLMIQVRTGINPFEY